MKVSRSHAGSYGSFGDGGVGLGNSVGSYGDPSGAFVNHRPPSGIVNPAFGISPETWRRMGQVPVYQGFGHAHLGMSPSNNFTPTSLGVSPSNFTPPSSYFQHSPGSSTGSPSRYGPLSPARSSGSGAAALGKAAALGQFNKLRGWGSPGSAVSANNGSQSGGIESSNLSWHGPVHQNLNAESVDTIPSSYNDGTSPLGSLRSFSHHGSHRQKSALVSGPVVEQTQTSKLSTYPIGSLGALMSKPEPTSTGGEDTSPPPNPVDWDSNFSEDLLFESDVGETVAGSAFLSAPPVVTGMQGLGVLMMEGSNGMVYASNGMLQDGPHSSVFRHGPVYMEDSAQTFHGWGPRPPNFNHQLQQISHSRLGQQSAHILQQQYPAFNLHLHEQLPHSVPLMQHNFDSSQIHFQGQRNEPLIGAFIPMSCRKDSR